MTASIINLICLQLTLSWSCRGYVNQNILYNGSYLSKGNEAGGFIPKWDPENGDSLHPLESRSGRIRRSTTDPEAKMTTVIFRFSLLTPFKFSYK